MLYRRPHLKQPSNAAERNLRFHIELLETRALLTGLLPALRTLDHLGLEDGGVPEILDLVERDDWFGGNSPEIGFPSGSAAAAGDFNGDGSLDLVIGVGFEDLDGEQDAGIVHTMYGTPRGISARHNETWISSQLGIPVIAGEQFGRAVVAGDFNNDNYDDLAIGQPGRGSHEGAVHVMFGSPDGLTTAGARFWTPSDPNIALGDSQTDFGLSLAVGDFDRNGYDDLAIGAPNHDVNGEQRAGSVIVLEFNGSANPSIDIWNQDNAISGSDSESNDNFGESLVVGDFNRDGKDDLVIGVPFEDEENFLFLPTAATGEVNVLYGSSSGLTSMGNQYFWQESSGVAGGNDDLDFFGEHMAVGDFDRDGFEDLAVGVRGDNDRAGSIRVLHGTSSGLTGMGSLYFDQDSAGIPEESASGDSFGAWLAAGDFNRDGYDDLAVAAPQDGITVNDNEEGAVTIIYGSSSSLQANGSRLLHEFSPGMPGLANPDMNYGDSLLAADFDSDGRDDLVVGVPRYSQPGGTSSGRVYVHYNDVSTFEYDIWHQDVPAHAAVDDHARFGTVVTSGDFNGDGNQDIVVGTPDKWLPRERFGFEIPDAGVVNVVYGEPSIDLLEPFTNQVLHQDGLHLEGGAEGGDRFGSALASGDFNNDGYDDLAIGAPYESLLDPAGNYRAAAGAVHVILGTSEGLGHQNFGLAQGRWRSFGEIEAGDLFGAALAAGDFDGDGFDDLVVGVPGQDVNNVESAGAIQLLFGNSLGIPGWERSEIYNQANGNVGGLEANDRFGAVLAAGDFNNNGFDDLAIGIPDESIGAIEDAGAVAVMYGRAPIGLDPATTVVISQSPSGSGFDVEGTSEVGDQFGYSLAIADFNEDGFSDLAIGVPFEDVDVDGVGQQIDAGTVNVVYSSAVGLTDDDNESWGQDNGSSSSTEAPGVAEANDLFGFALAADDFNDNGSADLAVGAPGDADHLLKRDGTVTVIYSDGNDGLDEDDTELWSQTAITGSSTTFPNEFGASLVAADFNNDVKADLAIGLPNRDLGGYVAAGQILTMRGTATINFNDPGDFDGDGELTIGDIDQLAVEAAAGTNNILFDLNDDLLVDLADVVVWIEDLYGTIMADGNLDFAVDGQDFLIWNDHKFQSLPGWSAGDYNADGAVDGQDFIVWNDNKFTSADVRHINQPFTPTETRRRSSTNRGELALTLADNDDEKPWDLNVRGRAL